MIGSNLVVIINVNPNEKNVNYIETEAVWIAQSMTVQVQEFRKISSQRLRAKISGIFSVVTALTLAALPVVKIKIPVRRKDYGQFW